MYELVKAHPQGIGLAGFGWYWGKRWPEVSMKEMQPCKSIKRAIQQYVDTVKVTDEDVVILRRLDDIGSRFGRSRLARSRSRSPRSASQAAQQDCPTNAALVQTIIELVQRLFLTKSGPCGPIWAHRCRLRLAFSPVPVGSEWHRWHHEVDTLRNFLASPTKPLHATIVVGAKITCHNFGLQR